MSASTRRRAAAAATVAVSVLAVKGSTGRSDDFCESVLPILG